MCVDAQILAAPGGSDRDALLPQGVDNLVAHRQRVR
jgi:hypothetical protein